MQSRLRDEDGESEGRYLSSLNDILFFGREILNTSNKGNMVLKGPATCFSSTEFPTKCLVLVFGRENRGIVEVEVEVEDCLVKEGGRGTSVPVRRQSTEPLAQLCNIIINLPETPTIKTQEIIDIELIEIANNTP